jgi:hypothetical protein
MAIWFKDVETFWRRDKKKNMYLSAQDQDTFMEVFVKK